MSDPDTQRRALLEQALKIAPFEGWTQSTLNKAEREASLTKGSASLYFPNGVMDMLDFWAADLDAQAAKKIALMDIATMKIRDRVTQGVLARLEGFGPHEEAARRASSRLAIPDGFGTGMKQIWNSADMIWRAIGDTSTDANFYSKRTILSGVIASTIPIWLSDNDPDKARARAFLDDRIANVMQFEKLKWQMKSATKDLPNPAEILGALRHGGITNLRKKPTGRQRRRRYSR